MIRRLMKQLNNTIKLEKYQEDKAMIIQPVVFWSLLILKKKIKLIVSNLIKQKTLDVDPRAIQQIIYKTNSSKYKSKWLNTVR